MSFQAEYIGEKLKLPDIDCDCGMPHRNPDMDIYIGNNILKNSGRYIKEKELGKRALVVTDNIIDDIAGKKVVDNLKQSGFEVKICILEREEELVPDETALGEVLLELDPEIDFLVAVGSGSINDITRYVAFNTNLPFVSIGTAPSMDGYTSVIAPLIYNKLKVNKPAQNPEVLICDLDIMKEAPFDLIISGFGDVVGKYIAIGDWIMGRIINEEEYCPVNVEIVFQAVKKCVDNVDGIINRTDKGIRSLIEALILAGVTILIIGKTRAVASNEHNMGHYIEMMKLLNDEKPARHGITVGMTTGYAIKFYEKFLKLDTDKINKDELKAKHPSREEWEETVMAAYGEKIGPQILKENKEGYLDWEERERRIDKTLNNFQKIRKELDFLPEYDKLKNMYKKLDLPLKAADISVNEELLQNALLYAKDYRDRYTVFKTAEELGVLQELVAEIIGSE
ncbi:MAG: sn-glycerol-1-phosphate dehydrogenase [Halanaerobiaceae bacterium]